MYENIIKNWKIAQESGAVLPCPRCGSLTMKEKIHTNATSRTADIYVCDDCGMREAMADFNSHGKNDKEKELENWFLIKRIFGIPQSRPDNKGNFHINASVEVTLTAEDIDDIMCAALEGGINYDSMLGYLVEAISDDNELIRTLRKIGFTDEQLISEDLITKESTGENS